MARESFIFRREFLHVIVHNKRDIFVGSEDFPFVMGPSSTNFLARNVAEACAMKAE